jgi:phytoene dehydrogenase-like protein
VSDAVVIGAGPNGLVAANRLADAGWDVLVLEGQDRPGGAVKTAEVTAPGFRNDLFSAFYPLGAASPVLRDLQLERWGLRWVHAPAVLAHPRPDGPAAVLSRDLDATAQSVERHAPGDGDAYRSVIDEWQAISEPLIAALLAPFPPVRASTRLALTAGVSGLRGLARLAVLPLQRLLEERFVGAAARLLFAGSALHADLTPESAGSGLFGVMLVGLGQDVGFPSVGGGAGMMTEALVRRLAARGGVVRCGAPVRQVVVRRGRAVGVVTADGTEVPARRAVLADCDVVQLYTSLVAPEHLPAALFDQLRRFQRGTGTVKVDWALSGPIPWEDPTVAPAGTVHITDDLAELSTTASELRAGAVPARPFLIVGQMTTTDPSRSPPGTESAWAYTHVPQTVRADAGGQGITGRWHLAESTVFADRMEARIEALAPGFRDRIIARHVMAPPDLERADPNLVGGDISGGTAQLHQQLVFRPVGGWARPETPVRRLFLASASAHPGGAVHGACGANAARAALLHHRLRR